MRNVLGGSGRSRLVQFCVQDHSDREPAHLHVMAHFRDAAGDTSNTEWTTVRAASVDDLRRAALQLTSRNINVHMHGPEVRKAVQRDLLDRLWSTSHELTEANVATLKREGRSSCPICLTDVAVGETLLFLPCSGSHIAHWACMQPWLESASTCPACRFELPTTAAEGDSQSHELLISTSLEAVERLKSASSLASNVSATRLARAQARSSTPPLDHRLLGELLQMGFEEGAARAALESTKGRLEHAIGLLVERSQEEVGLLVEPSH